MQLLVTALVVFPLLVASLSPFEKICQQYYAREAVENYTDSTVHGVVENICKNNFPTICKRYGIFLDVAVGETYTKRRYCCTGSNHVCYSCLRVRRSPTDGVDGLQPEKPKPKFPVRGLPDRLTKPTSTVTTTGHSVTSSRVTIRVTTPQSDDEDEETSGGDKLDISTTYFMTSESDGVEDARDEGRTTAAVGAVAGVLVGVVIILVAVIIIIHRKRADSRRSDENGASNGFKNKPAESGAYKNNSVYGFPDPSSVGSYDGLHLYDNAGASTDANTYEKLSPEPTREDYEKLHTYGNTLEHSGKRDITDLKNNQLDMYANVG